MLNKILENSDIYSIKNLKIFSFNYKPKTIKVFINYLLNRFFNNMDKGHHFHHHIHHIHHHKCKFLYKQRKIFPLQIP